jgi:hypothetical protein
VHHAAVHRGALIIEGPYSTGFRFLHADGGRYGAPNDRQAARLLSEELVRPHVRAGIEITDAVRMAFRASREVTIAAD